MFVAMILGSNGSDVVQIEDIHITTFQRSIK
jgi:hypothetical protein